MFIFVFLIITGLLFMKNILLFLCLGMLSLQTVSAQLSLTTYIDTYSAWDNTVIREGSYSGYRDFAVINGRKNQVGLNLAQISAAADFTNFYGKLTLQAGDIINQAWIGDYPQIQEAYAGIKFSERFSLDMGTFLTFVGTEVLHPKNNFLSSHSLVTFIEPFYHNGIRANFQVTDKVLLQLLLLNGVWTIQENNENKTLGMFLSYTADKLTVSYAGAFGNEEPGSPALARFQMFNNVCFYYNPTEKIGLIAQADFHNIFASDRDLDDDFMLMGFALQARYKYNEKFSNSLRVAFVDNSDGIASMAVGNAIDLTAGVEYRPIDNAYLRLEARLINFSNADETTTVDWFYNGKEYTNSRADISLNLGVYFDLLKNSFINP